MATRPTKDWQDRPSTATPIDAAALEDADDRSFSYTEDVVAEHSADTTNVHGIADTSTLASQSTIDSSIATHSADTTAVHGITDTSVLATATSVAAAVAAHEADTTNVHGITNTANLQPLDSDLTAIAALSTTSFGRSLLTLADAAAGLTAFGAQPSDSDLTAIAALTTTSFGRSLLTQADAAATLTTIGAQPVDSDLTSIAALTTTSYGRAFLALADAAAARTAVDAQQADTDLTAIAALTSAANKVPYATGSGTWSLADFTAAGRALVDDADATAQLATLGAYSTSQVDFITGALQARSTLTAKGDTYVATASGTTARQAVGANDTVLVADSAQTNGLKWAAVPNLAALASVYRTIFQGGMSRTGGTAGQTIWLVNSGNRSSSGTGGTGLMDFLRYEAADYPAVGSLTAKMRLRVMLATNGTAPTGDWTIGLYAVTGNAGSTTTSQLTIGSLVTGSDELIASAPAASTLFEVDTGDFTPPADGYYALGLVNSAAMAANSFVNATALVQIHHT